MPLPLARIRAMEGTKTRILDAALEVLGHDADAGMGEIAAVAGVVRRTVYGYFPTRRDLVETLAEQAAHEIAAALDEIRAAGGTPDAEWVDFITHLWPLAHRYRVLLALRRGEYGRTIHDLLGRVDTSLADIVKEGQHTEVFGRHLPPAVLSQVAFSAVFAIADSSISGSDIGVDAAIVTSLLILGVDGSRAQAFIDS